jgi:hypothetical protein
MPSIRDELKELINRTNTVVRQNKVREDTVKGIELLNKVQTAEASRKTKGVTEPSEET